MQSTPQKAQRVAITGGTGFVGRHLAARLREDPARPIQPVSISRRTGVGVADVEGLTRAFEGCDTVVHCAGINREIGEQTYDLVHVQGTAAVIAAAKTAGVRKVVMLSFLRARAGSGSPYHESKWQAEELIRASGLDYTILKAGMIYGHGDHLIDHTSRILQTIPVFASVGMRERTVRPVPVDELVTVLLAAIDGQLSRETVRVVGAEELKLSEVVRRVARVLDRRVLIVPAPVWAQYALGQVTEWVMKVPLVAKAQVRMLAEGVSIASPPASELPLEIRPKLPFSEEQIRSALPDEGRFGLRDLRWPWSRR